jgi:hypothetical protein
VIEVIFVFLIFREFLETDLLTAIGILHTSYWWVLLFAAWIREKCTKVWQRFLATYVPIVYHVIIHLIAWWISVEDMWQHHDEHSLLWIIIASISAGVLILVGEHLLHRTTHCETHHAAAHIHCHDEECEERHK